MIIRWPTLATLFTSWTLLVSVSFAAHTFENSAIARTVDLGGAVVQVKTSYAIRATSDNSSVYQFTFTKQENDKISFIEARMKGEEKALKLVDMGSASQTNVQVYVVELENSMNVNDTTTLELDVVQARVSFPWPEYSPQDGEQSLKYETDLFVLSPYPTFIQRTRIKASKILEYSTPENMEAHTIEEPVTLAGSMLTYGPYSDVPASTTYAFVTRKQQRIKVQYTEEFPVMEVEVKRFAEISHWGNNLNIEDHVVLHNTGPKLKGHFSRLMHQQQQFYRKPAPHVLTGLTLELPGGIRDAYYYDLIGNVSTSHLRVAPASPKNAVVKKPSILEFRPRYPLLGGWNYSYTFGWDSDLSNSASWNKETGRYIVAVPLLTPIYGAAFKTVDVTLVLPEGATDHAVETPFPATTEHSVVKTYLDTVGRPVITLKYQDFTERNNRLIYVSYKVPLKAHLQKPMAVAAAFFGLFTLAIGLRRVDARIHK